MRFRPFTLITFCAWMFFALSLALPRDARADGPATAPADLGENAALDYWQSFCWLTQWDKNQRQQLDEQFDTMPPQQAVQSLVPDRSSPLKFLRFGAQRQWCDFGLHLEQEGPTALLPYLNWVRLLAKLGLLRARVELFNRHPQAAAEYWAADLALARHVGADSIGVSLLVEYGVESLTIDQATRQLNELDKPALNELLQRLDALPTGGTPAQSVHVHQQIYQHWLMRKLDQATDNSWEQQVAEGYGRPLADVHAAAQTCGGTPRAVAEKLHDLDSIYDGMARVSALPYDQFEKAFPAIDAKFKANPAHSFVYWDFSRICQRAALERARMALLKAAIAVVRDGPDALKDHPDPFGKGPVKYQKLDLGFQLSSQLHDPDHGGNPLTLTVGGSGK